MSSFTNKRKSNYLAAIPEQGLENDHCNLTIRCKFNFSYFDRTQAAGQNFNDWGLDGLESLLVKLTEFSKESLQYWAEKGVYKNYRNFPTNTEFSHPKFVPHDVHWGRFRLEGKVRLAGFVIPGSFHNKKHKNTDVYFDCNTFYIVFLDENHVFYKQKKK